MTRRSALHALRSPDALIVTAALPVALLLLMTVVFGGAVSFTVGSYIDYVTPGVIALCVSYGASQTALNVALDARNGATQRYRTIDIPSAAPILGHMIIATVKNLFAVLLVLAAAASLGAALAWSPLHLAGLAVIVVLTTASIATLSAAVGLIVSSPEAAAGLSFIMLFLPYVSSAFVPLNTLPQWIRDFARLQPFTPLTESTRAALFAGDFAPHALPLLLWLVGIAILSSLLLPTLLRRNA